MSIDEYNETLLLLAGIALPGIIITTGGTLTTEKIARDAFNVAQAMLDEYGLRKEEPKNN